MFEGAVIENNDERKNDKIQVGDIVTLAQKKQFNVLNKLRHDW